MTDIRTPVLERATQLQAIWDSYVTTTHAALRAKSAAIDTLLQLSSDRPYALSNWKISDNGQQFFSSLVDLLVTFLRRQLARQGYSPKIELDDRAIYGEPPDFRSFSDSFTGATTDMLHEFACGNMTHAGTRSLLDVANQLLDEFTPDKARKTALSQSAACLDHYFRPYSGASDRIVDRGRSKVISRHLATYTSDPWEMTHASRTLIHEVVDHIRLLLADAGLPDAVQHTHSLSMTLARGSYASRQSVQCGPGLTLVFFKQRIEYHFQPSVLDALQIAITEAKQAIAS